MACAVAGTFLFFTGFVGLTSPASKTSSGSVKLEVVSRRIDYVHLKICQDSLANVLNVDGACFVKLVPIELPGKAEILKLVDLI